MAKVAEETLPRDQVERILHSETFRNSDSLRRLLSYLADRTLAGEADQLKEYTIGLEAFGKPATYDPRQDSIVRLQVGRLRQKLADYYHGEGATDRLIVDVPKGRFRLNFEPGNGTAAVTVLPDLVPPVEPNYWRPAALTLAVALMAALGWMAITRSTGTSSDRALANSVESWTPELEALWAPVLSSQRPLMISAAAPLFVNIGTDYMLRALAINSWEDTATSQPLADVRRALHNLPIRARYHYAPVGEVNAAFLLGKLLGSRKEQMFLANSNQISWQQYADDNMVLIGPPAVFDELVKSLPVSQEFSFEKGSIRNLHPGPGEPPSYQGVMSSGSSEDGEVYAIITHAPSPQEKGHVLSFTCNTTSGCLGAVQAFTEPALARAMTARLKDKSGHLPDYYQIVAKVVFKDTVPVATTYVVHRELHPKKPE